jgi:hypothetical protein
MIESPSIVIPSNVFQSLPVEAQDALIAALRGDASEPGEPGRAASSEVLARSDEVLDVHTDLSPARFKELVDGCSVKSKAALRAMVEGPSPNFRVASVARAAGCLPSELTGVWSGITKRVRTVTGDRKAYLWVWGEPERDVDGRYLDQDGRVSETTYRSGRRVFGL